ncbi:MAG: histidinol dehydrogenase [Proteobacteria bacterium]|nr:histidinol dehydrogenase [Pseudomonadota bacterium]
MNAIAPLDDNEDLPIREWAELDSAAQAALLARPTRTRAHDITVAVADIIAVVREQGDAALREFTRRFDGVERVALAVDAASMGAAVAHLDPALRSAMERALARIHAYHVLGAAAPYALETAPGVLCERILRPLDRVGFYIPAGSAPLPSTVLMLGAPARIAGCGEVIACTPPRADGSVDPVVLAAAKLCGIDRVFAVGGAQAIAAMAFGTDSIPRCDKLFGPGNAWVTEAKRQVAAMPDGVAIDMPAGPSEVLVIADADADPHFVAADLLAQAEHGPDSQVLLLTDSRELAQAVRPAIRKQLAALPRRAIAAQALAHSRLIVVETLADALAISNRYAPEHLIVQVAEPRALLAGVRAAGSVFLGAYSPESVGDYCSGTNHVLPTDGWARAYSGVSVASFQRAISVQELSRDGLARIGPDAITLAQAEGLHAHAQAVRVRLSITETETAPDVRQAGTTTPNSAYRLGDGFLLGSSSDTSPSPACGGRGRSVASWIGEDQTNFHVNDGEDQTLIHVNERVSAVASALDLARPELLTLAGYSSARMEASSAGILLNANESPWPQDDASPLNRYPNPQPQRLRAALAELYGVDSARVLIGRGSDEMIDLLVRAFCRAGRDAILVQPPTFGMYAVCAAVQGAAVRSVPLSREQGFVPDFAAVLATVDAAVKLVFVCAPNNPTGSAPSRQSVLDLADALRGRALVVADEAYVEFADAPSFSKEVAARDNLAILRTLSKAHALAAARIGCLIAAPEIIGLLRRIMPPYPLPTPCVQAAEAALSPAALRRTHERIALTCAERERLRCGLLALPGVREVLSSQANFLTVRFDDAGARFRQLRASGLTVRDVRRYHGLDDALRITVGSPAENAALLAALAQPLEDVA